jgi:hypothetical protein
MCGDFNKINDSDHARLISMILAIKEISLSSSASNSRKDWKANLKGSSILLEASCLRRKKPASPSL